MFYFYRAKLMEMKIKKLLVCCLAAATFISCKKNDIDVPDPDLKALFDTWNLVQKSGGFSGGTETPATMGYQLSVKFDKDGHVYRYKDGAFESQDKFEFVYQDAAHVPNGTHYTLKYEQSPLSQWVYIHKDTLYLDDAFCNDCYSYIYVRK